jgi:hypothetical protein
MDTNLLDTHNRLVADVIAHFRTLTMLATIQTEAAERQIDPQTIAVTGLSMQMEFEGLVSCMPPRNRCRAFTDVSQRIHPSRTSSH